MNDRELKLIEIGFVVGWIKHWKDDVIYAGMETIAQPSLIRFKTAEFYILHKEDCFTFHIVNQQSYDRNKFIAEKFLDKKYNNIK